MPPTMSPVDLVILTNAPGELTTWVYPVLTELVNRQEEELGLNFRVSVVLSPCPHAAGNEAAIAAGFPLVQRVLAPEHFYKFLLWQHNWDWAARGVVLFLGGDQIFPILIGKRLGYQTLIYAEWEARWLAWGDRYALRHRSLPIPTPYLHKTRVVGDLMVDRHTSPRVADPKKIVLLPGSNP